MAFINGYTPATTSVSNATQGNLTITTQESTGEVTIPAGAYWVKIRAAGYVQDGDENADATVAGATWSVGREETWESFYDRENNILYLLPSIIINGNGGRVFVTYAA